MNTLLHILGSDIPHHNQTILDFFNYTLAELAPSDLPREFWMVTQDNTIAEKFPALRIRTFTSKRAIAQAVILRAQHRQQQFFCHGQFNLALWIALLSGKIQRHQLHWHIWGADLHESSNLLRFKFFYPLRRRLQGRVASVWGTLGDLAFYQQKHPSIEYHQLYFPTRLPSLSVTKEGINKVDPLVILLGNSGDPSNRHQHALAFIRRQFGQQVKILIPMGYPANNQQYIEQVRHDAARLFSDGQVIIFDQPLNFAAYTDLLAECDLGYFAFERQQGIGTISLLIEQNIPVILQRKNSFWHDMVAVGLPVLFEEDELSLQVIQQAAERLSGYDKTQIPFFSPGYLQGWQQMLQILPKGKH